MSNSRKNTRTSKDINLSVVEIVLVRRLPTTATIMIIMVAIVSVIVMTVAIVVMNNVKTKP